MEQKQYLTGSRAFFDGMEGFTPHDTDIVDFNPTMHHAMSQINNEAGVTVFRFKMDKAEDIIDFFLQWPNPSSQLCCLLVHDIAKRVGMTVDDLPRLQPLIDALDKRHKYLADIYDAYVKKGSFKLYKYQREKAFKTYLAARKEK